MSFSIRNVRKFFEDNPEFGDVEAAVVESAEEFAHKNVISGQHIGIFGKLFPRFRSELVTDQGHIDMWMEDVGKVSGSLGAMVDLSLAFWEDIAGNSDGVVCSINNGAPGKLDVLEKEDGWEFRHPAFGDGTLTIYKAAGDTTPADLGMRITREIGWQKRTA